jgi:hypothetical protein
VKNISAAITWILVSLFSLKAAAKADLTSFEFLDNRIIAQILINNQGPYSVMIDTGATNILSSQLATELSIPSYDRFPISGGGENILYGSYCDVQKLEISTKILWGSRFICLDLSEMQRAIGFRRLDGIIGYEVFAQFLTEINFDKMDITLKDFSERNLKQSIGHIIPFTFEGPTPLIEISLDGVAGKLLLDTGDRASATLATPFIEQNNLIEKYQPKFSTMTGHGLGGPLKTAMAFANQFNFGGLEFSKTLIRLPTTKSPGLSISGIAGTLGMGLLRQFNIVLDYSRQEMILSKNSAFSQDRSFDRGGLWISPIQNGFQILDVLENGPAWNSGLRTGQVILAVNNVPASNLNIFTLREQLKDPNTLEVTVLVQEGARVFATRILLKNLFEDEIR